MDRTEKAYFKKFGFKRDTTGNQKLSELFDLYDRTAANWPEKAQKLGIENLALSRNRLYHVVISSIRDYNKKHSEEEALFEAYRNAEILLDRGLGAEADSILRKAINKAEQLQLAELRLLLEQKRHHSLFASGQQSLITDNIRGRKAQADRLSVYMQLNDLYNQVYNMQISQGQNPSRKQRSELEQLIQQVQDKKIDTTDLLGQMLQCNTLQTIYFNMGMPEFSLQYSAMLKELYEDNPTFLEHRKRQYILALFNYLNDCIQAGKMYHFTKDQPKLTRLANEDSQLTPLATLYNISLQLDFLLHEPDAEKWQQFYPEFNQWYKTYGETMPPNRLLDMLSRMAYVCYLCGFPEEALDELRIFQQHGSRGTRQDLEWEMALLQVTIQYQKDQWQLAQYQIKAVSQRFKELYKQPTALGLYAQCLSHLLQDNPKRTKQEILADYAYKVQHHDFPELRPLLQPEKLIQDLIDQEN